MSSNYLGNQVSLYPFHNRRGDINVVSDVWACASRILTVILTQRGEDKMHPDMGMAPELFKPLSHYSPNYFVHQMTAEISKWNTLAKIGLRALKIETTVYEDYRNGIAMQIWFTPVNESSASVLTFGYWEYIGAVYSNNIDEFRDGLSLNGVRMKALA